MESKKIRYACHPDLSVPSSLPISNNGAEPVAHLTSQERRVINLVAEALSNKEIAVELGISPCTVKRHIENILRKLNLKNRVDAAIYAIRNGHAQLEIGRGSDPI
jgi:DNA-binding NarL/FixJ family response regulator